VNNITNTEADMIGKEADRPLLEYICWEGKMLQPYVKTDIF
jgi:hypothetical protein